MKSFLVAGGDLRSVYLARKLAEKNKVYALGFDKNMIPDSPVMTVDSLVSLHSRPDCIVLPIPVSNDGVMVNCPYGRNSIPLSGLVTAVKENGTVFGGKISESVRSMYESAGLTVIDYLDREELSVMNAVPTAEGAVQIAMEELAETIFGQEILITGMGRISKVLIRILTGMGAHVTVTARKYSDLAWAEIFGCRAVHIAKIDSLLPQFSIVFNTVPAMIFDEKRLGMLKSGCLLIDLASKPGGVDFDAAGRSGVKTIWALSLPGKTAPVTSGEMIASAINNILEERGENS